MGRANRAPVLVLAFTPCLAVACTAPGAPVGTHGGDAEQPTSSGSATPTMVESQLYPYFLRLPDGWVANASNVDEDSYESADGRITLTVGTGQPEPGQTVEDRVRINREHEFGGCESDPGEDRPIDIGGEPGILWSFRCGGVEGVAANTIHDGLGYRLTLKGTQAATSELEPIMAEVLASFAFSE